jgi:hypothetical protein
MSTRIYVGAVTAVLALLNGCTDQVDPTAPEQSSSSTAQDLTNLADPALVRSPVEAQRGQRPERISQRVARQVPAFGGGFVENGVLQVHLTDMGAAGQARSAIASEMRRGGRTGLDMEFRPARYTLRQLDGWHGRLSSGGGIRHPLVYTEIDERENRIRIGIENSGAETLIRTELARKQVPHEAVIFQVAKRGQPLNHHLRDRVRPLRGGTQTRTTYSGAPDNFFCTYGFNVWYNSMRHMVVNSHCTQDVNAYGWGGYIGAILHQPNTGPWYDRNRHQIGKEVNDPAFYQQWGCDPNQASHGCRWSDAALVELSTSDWDFGGISRPTQQVFLPTINGSLNINSTFPRLGLVDTYWQGDQLDKVGRTTGWTSGTVVNTCRTEYLWSNVGTFGFICSGIVTAGAGRGDSGSPVFQYTPTSTHLAGILYGGRISQAIQIEGEWVEVGSEYFFSRWDEVNYELGWYGLTVAGNP